MLCRCLNDLNVYTAIRRTIGLEVTLICREDGTDAAEQQNELALQDWVCMSAAPTFPPHEVIRPFRPRKRLRRRIHQFIEELLYI